MIPRHTLHFLSRLREFLNTRGESATLKEMQQLAGGLEGPIKEKLQQVLRMAQARKEFDSDKEADELDQLLRQANLSKPKALSTKQYDAVADVWEALSEGDFVAIARTAMRALNMLGESKEPTDLNQLIKLPRFEFIAEYLVMVTRKKADRDLVQGYQVKKKGKIYQVVQTQVAKGTVTFETEDPAKLFDFVRRGPLGYYTRQADDLRASQA